MKLDSRIAFWIFAVVLLGSGLIGVLVSLAAGTFSISPNYLGGVAAGVVLTVIVFLVFMGVSARRVRLVQKRFPGALVFEFIGRDDTWHELDRTDTTRLQSGLLVSTTTDIRVLKGLTKPQIVTIIPYGAIVSIHESTGLVGIRRVPRVEITVNTPSGPSMIPLYPTGRGMNLRAVSPERMNEIGETLTRNQFGIAASR